MVVAGNNKRGGRHRQRAQVTRHLRTALFATTALGALAVAPVARAADGVDALWPLPGGFSVSIFLSGNGNVSVRSTRFGGPPTVPLMVSNGASTVLPSTVPGSQTTANALNFDGSVIVGSSNVPSQHAVMWTAGGTVVTDLHSGAAFNPGGSLEGYLTSFARGVSADGSVVVGSAAGAAYQAFRWTQATGMVGLGFLPGYDWSGAEGVSGDGQTIAGAVSSTVTMTGQAAYWTQGSGWVGLGVLPGGTTSAANAISRNGEVIVGTSNDGSGQRAFRWTQSGGMESLGILPGGGNSSYANAVNADGSVVVGRAITSTSTDAAFRWTRASGLQSLASVLSAGGVRLGGMTLLNATGVSDDGKTIVGYGRNTSNQIQYYIARCESALCQGLATLEDTAKSFGGQAAVSHTANAAIGGALGTMQEYVTQARASQASRNTRYSVFAYGAYDSDPVTSGTLGLTVDLPNEMVAGFTVSANRVTTEMVHDGNAKMNGGSLGAFIARTPEAGLQWLLGASAMTLKGDVTRGYLNGISPTASAGSTSGNGLGVTARIGWSFAPAPQMQVTPFASYTASLMHFDGYTETTGVFAAQFDGMKSTAQTSRLGADARYTFGPGRWMWSTLAWGYRLDGGKGTDVTGALIDAFPLSVPGIGVSQDWLEIGGGVRLPAWKSGAVTVSLTASVPASGATTYLARVGLTQNF